MEDFSRGTNKYPFYDSFLAKASYLHRFRSLRCGIIASTAFSACILTIAFLTESPTISAEELATSGTAAAIVSATKIAPETSTATLIGRLRDPSPAVRITAVEQLTDRGERAAEALPEMILLLADDAITKPTTEKPIPNQVYVVVYAALPKIGPAAVPPLVEALKNPNPTLRYRAAMTLGQFETAAPMIAPALQMAMRDENPLVRANAAGSFGAISTSLETAGPVLVAFLRQEKESGPRFAALNALARLDREGTVAVPFLIESLKDRDTQVRFLAVEQLGRYGGKAKPAVPALIVALKDKGERNELLSPTAESSSMPLYYEAMTALQQIGPDAVEALPALKNLFHDDPNPFVRIHAAEAIEKIDPSQTTAMKMAIRDLKKHAALVEATGQAIDAMKSR